MLIKRFSYSVSLLVVLFAISSCALSTKEAHVDLKKFDVKKLSQFDNIVPIAILGSGPAGLSAAVYGARAQLQTVVLEGAMPGGLLTQTTGVENWPGDIEIMGPKIIENLRAQAGKWGTSFVHDTVERVDFTGWPFKLYTADGRELHALSVIIATGATPRYLGIPGEKEYWGQGVTTCAVCDAPFYENEEVVVVGGGDSAAEEAMQLAPYARKVTILVRKDHMRASATMQEHLKKYPHISVRYNVEVKEIHGDGSQVTGITLYNNKEDVTEQMPINGVFLAIGHIPNTGFLQDAVELLPSGHVKVEGRTQETSVPGVFTAGDVADHRYRQAGVSAGHGISAALDATFFLSDIGFTDVLQKELAAEQRLFNPEAPALYEVTEVNDLAAFEALLKEDVPVVADFYAEWCPSCMQMLPAYSAVAQSYESRVQFVKVDADQGGAIMRQFDVQKVPALLAFKNGKIVKRYVATITKTELNALAEELLA